jgi:hypothetical protein
MRHLNRPEGAAPASATAAPQQLVMTRPQHVDLTKSLLEFLQMQLCSRKEREGSSTDTRNAREFPSELLSVRVCARQVLRISPPILDLMSSGLNSPLKQFASAEHVQVLNISWCLL